MQLDDYAVSQIFTPFYRDDKLVAWYASTVDRDGYLVVWPDNSHLHTYRFPPDWL